MTVRATIKDDKKIDYIKLLADGAEQDVDISPSISDHTAGQSRIYSLTLDTSDLGNLLYDHTLTLEIVVSDGTNTASETAPTKVKIEK